MFKEEILRATRDFTKKEMLMMKDTKALIKLDNELKPNGDPIIIKYPFDYVIKHVWDDKENGKDFESILLLADGKIYTSSSRALINRVEDLLNEMKDEEDEWGIQIYKAPSKQFEGRYYITCSLI